MENNRLSHRGWHLRPNRKNTPASPGCYAIYINGRLSYVGSTTNLRARAWCHVAQTRPVLFYDEPARHAPRLRVVVKVKLSRRFGDWLMWEARLIHRLNPPRNRALKARAA